MSRRSRRRGLQVGSGERYALLPREVAESAAYHATPDWARSVLTALLMQYTGTRNGSLALPADEAHALGVRQPWQVYAGLRVIEYVDLVLCTRRGHLSRGTRLASLYALTWRGIDEPREGVAYDASVRVCPIPSHAWSQWTRPDDWPARVRDVVDRARGAGNRRRARDRVQHLAEDPDTMPVGSGRTHSVGTGDVPVVPTAWGSKQSHLVPTAWGASEISGRGGIDAAIATMILFQAHLPDCDIAQSCSVEIEQVARVRARMAEGWRP